MRNMSVATTMRRTIFLHTAKPNSNTSVGTNSLSTAVDAAEEHASCRKSIQQRYLGTLSLTLALEEIKNAPFSSIVKITTPILLSTEKEERVLLLPMQ